MITALLKPCSKTVRKSVILGYFCFIFVTPVLLKSVIFGGFRLLKSVIFGIFPKVAILPLNEASSLL